MSDNMENSENSEGCFWRMAMIVSWGLTWVHRTHRGMNT